ISKPKDSRSALEPTLTGSSLCEVLSPAQITTPVAAGPLILAKTQPIPRRRSTLMGHPDLDLAGKTAVVIGGTSGIGRALAKGLAQAGANVVPTGRRTDLGQQGANEIKCLGRRPLVASDDVTDQSSLQALLGAAVSEFGSVEILVNCAGRTKRTPTLNVSEEEWNGILETNLHGTLWACQVFGPHMIERKYGR